MLPTWDLGVQELVKSTFCYRIFIEDSLSPRKAEPLLELFFPRVCMRQNREISLISDVEALAGLVSESSCLLVLRGVLGTSHWKLSS